MKPREPTPGSTVQIPALLTWTSLRSLLLVCLLGSFLMALGCASNTPRYESPNRRALGNSPPPTTTSATPVTAAVAAPGIKLDIGIEVFNPGVEGLDVDQKITTPSVRRAEAHYIPKVLANTLNQRGVWGLVRVIPNKQTEMDVWIDGKILDSDGTELALSIKVTDATGLPWYTREYREEIDRYAFDIDPTVSYRDPFQKIYERIADDLQREAASQQVAALHEIHAVTQLQFAQRFAPEQFNGYLMLDSEGRTRVQSLPAVDDPALQRMADLRARDLMFVDSLDEYFTDYTREMQPSYDRWRETNHEEVTRMSELKRSSALRKIGGALAVLGGIAAAIATDNAAIGTAGIATAAGGAFLFGSGVEKGREATIHEAALEELADSFGTGMKTHHIELSNRSVTLSGTVEEQSAQWRALLAEIYRAENVPGIVTDPLPVITTDQATPLTN
ncbi:MAG: hypothetical protein EXR86_12640 [Gammaproteobacteria bacterium]|nr:hypothetical protein [Gammaproteobacteria bacterium]